MAVLINGICFHFKEPLQQSDMLFGRQVFARWHKQFDLDGQKPASVAAGGRVFFLYLTPHAYLGHTSTKRHTVS